MLRMSTLGDHLRAARLRQGVTQRSLARRAGTTQAAISRIESGKESPSFERFTALLSVLGVRALLQTAPLEHDLGPDDLKHGRTLTPTLRLAESASWNLVTTSLEIAATAAKAQPPR